MVIIFILVLALVVKLMYNRCRTYHDVTDNQGCLSVYVMPMMS